MSKKEPAPTVQEEMQARRRKKLEKDYKKRGINKVWIGKNYYDPDGDWGTRKERKKYRKSLQTNQ